MLVAGLYVSLPTEADADVDIPRVCATIAYDVSLLLVMIAFDLRGSSQELYNGSHAAVVALNTLSPDKSAAIVQRGNFPAVSC